jgi:hypothetical protein
VALRAFSASHRSSTARAAPPHGGRSRAQGEGAGQWADPRNGGDGDGGVQSAPRAVEAAEGRRQGHRLGQQGHRQEQDDHSLPVAVGRVPEEHSHCAVSGVPREHNHSAVDSVRRNSPRNPSPEHSWSSRPFR